MITTKDKKHGSLGCIESVTKVITTIGDLQISHKVTIFKQPKKGSSIPTDYIKNYNSKVTMAGRMGFPSYYLRETRDYVVISEGLGRYTPEYKKEKLVKGGRKASVMLSYDDVENIRFLFSNASRWFIEEEYRNNMFKYDSSGIPYGIDPKYEGINTLVNLSVGNGNFLSIQPTVITNAMEGIAYPGVEFKCTNGKIGECTMTEFFTFKKIVKTLLDNLYNNTLCLLNHFMLLKTEGGDSEDYVIF